jgi:hypothetical protein
VKKKIKNILKLIFFFLRNENKRRERGGIAIRDQRREISDLLDQIIELSMVFVDADFPLGWIE